MGDCVCVFERASERASESLRAGDSQREELRVRERGGGGGRERAGCCAHVYTCVCMDTGDTMVGAHPDGRP